MSLEQPFNVAPASERLERGIPMRARWGAGSIIVGIGIGLLLFFTAAVAAAPVVSHYGKDSAEALAAEAIATGVWDLALAGTVLPALALRKGATIRDLGLRGPWHGEGWSLAKLALWVGGAYVGSLFLVSAYSAIVNLLGLDFLEPGKQVPTAFYDHRLAAGAAAGHLGGGHGSVRGGAVLPRLRLRRPAPSLALASRGAGQRAAVLAGPPGPGPGSSPSR